VAPPARLEIGAAGRAARGERADGEREEPMTESRKYTLTIKVRADFKTVRQRTVDALAGQGFGVLTEIDVQETLRRKLGAEFRPYVILGACNPPLAHRALSAEPEIGALLPCNVVVWAEEDATCTVCAQDPVRQFGLVGNPQVAPVAVEAQERLRRALEDVRRGLPS